MASVTSFLVFAFVAISAVRSEICGSIQIGKTSDSSVPLSKTILQPGIADWEVTVPNVPQCQYGESGVIAIVCDADVKPNANFVNFNLIRVHRVGNLQGSASVTPTVFCNQGWQSNPQPWVNNQRWPSQGLIDQPQWQNTQYDIPKVWDETPQIVIARPQ